jgi:hypothetical protein
MKRAGHEDVKFFIGTEVEHTPALGLKTLFVVGVQPIVDIIQTLSDPYTQINQPIEHIYFGANMSFPNPPVNDFHTWKLWEDMIKPCLGTGILCTLDVDSTCVEGLVESDLTEYSNFIPMISVKLPYMSQLGYNATIKLDDRDFAASNPGVWCHSLHTLQNREVFTPWSRYTKDEIVK